MGSASKAAVSEREAAVQFLLAVFLHVRDQWMAICEALRPLMTSTDKLDAPSTELEFSMATIALQMHALDLVFPPAQASRIRSHVLTSLLTTEPGEAALEALKVYDRVWRLSVEAGQRPYGAMAAAFCHRAGFTGDDLPADAGLADSIFASTLGDALMTTMPGWWKALVRKRNVLA
jgi:hypothetical protein